MKHMDINQRLTIKKMLDEGKSKQAIADNLGVHVTTVYNELKRKNPEGIYDPYYAQLLHEEEVKRRGRTDICSDPLLAEFISKMILEEHMSPERIVTSLIKDDKGFRNVPQAAGTIYSAVNRGLIPGVTKDTLLTMQSTVFNNGQVSIPKWVLNKLHIHDGDILLLEVTPDNRIIYKKKEGEKAE